MEGRQQTGKLDNASTHPVGMVSNHALSAVDVLPAEIMEMIFSHLPHKTLHNIKLVSKYWKMLAGKPHYDKQQQQQELWQYLPAMANDKDILIFTQKYIGPIEGESAKSLTLSELCENFQKDFPAFDGNPYGKKLTADYIKEKALFIWNRIQAHYPPQDSTPYEPLKNLLNFSIEHTKEQEEIFLAYQEMDTIFAVMRVTTQLWVLENFTSKGSRRINPSLSIQDIIDVVYNYGYWLTGTGLVLINNVYISFIPDLIQQSISLQKEINQNPDIRQDQLSEQLKLINFLLSTINAADWLDFLAPSDDVYTRTKPILLAIQENHSVVLAQCTKMVLLKVIENVGYTNTIQDILKSPIAVNHLSDECIIELTSQLFEEQFEEILIANPSFLKRFNFKLTKCLLEKGSFRANALLKQADFMSMLGTEQISEVANYLMRDDFVSLLNSKAFTAQLDNIANTKGEKERSRFLVSLATITNNASAITENPDLANMLEPDDIVEISLLSVAAGLSLIKNSNIIAKLHYAQIVDIACSDFELGTYLIPQLKDEDLQQVVSVCVDIYVNLYDTDAPQTAKELFLDTSLRDKRANIAMIKNEKAVKRLDSEQIIKMACHDIDVGLYVAEYHLNNLEISDLQILVDKYSNQPEFYRDNKFIWQKLIDKAKQQRLNVNIPDEVKDNKANQTVALYSENHDNIIVTRQSEYKVVPVTSSLRHPIKEEIPNPKKPVIDLNWKKGLKFVGLLLFAAIGIGFIVTGVGAFIGIPLLFQILLIAIGSLCVVSSVGVAIYNLLSDQSDVSKMENDSGKSISNSQVNVIRVLSHEQQSFIGNTVTTTQCFAQLISIVTEKASIIAHNNQPDEHLVSIPTTNQSSYASSSFKCGC